MLLLISTARRTLIHKYPAISQLFLVQSPTKLFLRIMSTKVKSEEEWRAQLSPEQFKILREKVRGTLQADRYRTECLL
jgi:hypothetical protein